MSHWAACNACCCLCNRSKWLLPRCRCPPERRECGRKPVAKKHHVRLSTVPFRASFLSKCLYSAVEKQSHVIVVYHRNLQALIREPVCVQRRLAHSICMYVRIYRGDVPEVIGVLAGETPWTGVTLGTEPVDVLERLIWFCCATAIFLRNAARRLRAPSMTTKMLACWKCRRKDARHTLDDRLAVLSLHTSDDLVTSFILLRARLAHQWFVFTLKHGLEQHDTSHVA